MMGAVLPGLWRSFPSRSPPLFLKSMAASRITSQTRSIRNMRDPKTKVREVSADLGIAFDGDGDRAMFVDERGELAPSDQITALLADEFLAKRSPARRSFTTCARRGGAR